MPFVSLFFTFSPPHHCIMTFLILMSLRGLSYLSFFAFPIADTTSNPFVTLPNTVCQKNSQKLDNLPLKNHQNQYFFMHSQVSITKNMPYFPIKPVSGSARDEELRPICIRSCIRHRHCTYLVVLQFRINLILELPTPNGFT